MMPARSVRAKRRGSSAASTSAAVACAAGVAGAAGGAGLRDSSAGLALLPERTLSGRRGVIELAPRLFCIVVHK